MDETDIKVGDRVCITADCRKRMSDVYGVVDLEKLFTVFKVWRDVTPGYRETDKDMYCRISESEAAYHKGHYYSLKCDWVIKLELKIDTVIYQKGRRIG